MNDLKYDNASVMNGPKTGDASVRIDLVHGDALVINFFKFGM